MSVAGALLPWSDDLYLHGHQLVRWITDYVDLEESLAVGSIAQEEVAHANAFMEQAGCSISDRDWRIYVREPSDWFPSALVLSPAEDWPATVARGYLFTRGVLVMIDCLGRRREESLRRTAVVVGAEQRLHAAHWRRWVDILGRHPALAGPFAGDLAVAAEACGDLFGVPGGKAASLDPEAMHGLWIESVRSELAELGVGVPLLPESVVERPSGAAGSDLKAVLRSVRELRDRHPDRVYTVYQ